LPSSDSEGSVSGTDDAYNDKTLSILSGTAADEHATISDYTGTSRLVTLNTSLGTEAVSGDTYLLMEDWPEEWSDALAYAVLYRIGDAKGEWAALYDVSMRRARELSVLRQTQQSRETRYFVNY
jgi:hypothetical protein